MMSASGSALFFFTGERERERVRFFGKERERERVREIEERANALDLIYKLDDKADKAGRC